MKDKNKLVFLLKIVRNSVFGLKVWFKNSLFWNIQLPVVASFDTFIATFFFLTVGLVHKQVWLLCFTIQIRIVYILGLLIVLRYDGDYELNKFWFLQKKCSVAYLSSLKDVA